MFGIKDEILEKALKEGILLENDGKYVPNIGTVSLIYHPQLRRYALVFGTTAANAGFVLLEDLNKTWKIK